MTPSQNSFASHSSVSIRHAKKNIFIFHGKDRSVFEHHLQQIVKKTLKKLAGSQTTAKNLVTCFYGNRHTLSEIAETLSSLDFFASHKLSDVPQNIVVVENYAGLSAFKAAQKLIESCPLDAILYLVKSELPFSSKGFENFVRKHKQVEVHLEFFVSKERIQKLIQRDLEKVSMKLDSECLGFLVELFSQEPDRMAMLQLETAKLAAYFHDYPQPLKGDTLGEIKNLIIAESSLDNFSVIEAVLSKNRIRALRLFGMFLRQSGNMLEFCMIIQQELRKLIEYKEMFEKSMSEEEVFKRLRLFYKRAKDSLRRHARHFTREELCDMLEAFLIVETSLKSEGPSISLSPQAAKVNLIAKCQIEKIISSCL